MLYSDDGRVRLGFADTMSKQSVEVWRERMGRPWNEAEAKKKRKQKKRGADDDAEEDDRPDRPLDDGGLAAVAAAAAAAGGSTAGAYTRSLLSSN